MKRLIEQLDSIKAIVDTVTPTQIEQDPQKVNSGYELYAKGYDPIDEALRVKKRLIDEVGRGRTVTGYLSAEYGYGKTATLVYLWHECQQKQIATVPPFKFKELSDLMVASYGWIKHCLSNTNPELIPKIESLYQKYRSQSQEAIAAKIAKKRRISESTALEIVREDINYHSVNVESILGFWWESVPLLKQAGLTGLAIFADESEGFLRVEEGTAVRIQQLTDLIMGLRSKPDIPIALVLTVVSSTVEPLLEEQAGAIIARMKEQGVYLPLANAYGNLFPANLWQSLCKQFIDDQSQSSQIVHPGTLESLGQLCDRKDLSSGPRAVTTVFKRMVRVFQDSDRSYTPLDLVEDYYLDIVQLYGPEDARIRNAINELEQLEVIKKHPKGRDVARLLAIFPAGVSESVAQDLGLLDAVKELADDATLIGQYIKRTERNPDRFALISLAAAGSAPTSIVNEILKNFAQRWRDVWSNADKSESASKVFQEEILPLLLPPKQGTRSNWSWKNWKYNKLGIPYLLLEGAPSDYEQAFPKRSLVVSVGSPLTQLGKFKPPDEVHLDWRFSLVYPAKDGITQQKLWAIAGTNQLQFELQLGRTFEGGYPKDFGMLNNVMSPESCSACTLLNLSKYIQEYLERQTTQLATQDQKLLEQYRRDLHRYALQLLIPENSSENWAIEGLKDVTGTQNRLIDSVFNQHCETLFPQYHSFAAKLSSDSKKSYKFSLGGKVPLGARKGRIPYQALKEEFRESFCTSNSNLLTLLSALKSCLLIEKSEIAGKREEESRVTFTEHPLEKFIREQLEQKGRLQSVNTRHGSREVRELTYPALWEQVKKLGYLEDEFQEALEWSQLRQYVEWDKSKPVHIIREATGELDADELRGQLVEIQSKVIGLVTAFGRTELGQVETLLQQAEQDLNSNPDDEVALDQVQRSIHSCRERLGQFRISKQSVLQEELKRIKAPLETFTRDLNLAGVAKPIQGNSGLERCLTDYQITLKQQVSQLDQECQDVVAAIRLDETDIFRLHEKIQTCKESLERFKQRKQRLMPLVNGLEKWRVIVQRAGSLYPNLDPARRQGYEYDFLDRVITHFGTHLIESFGEWEALSTPLDLLEQQIKGEQRQRQSDFDACKSQYEALLKRIDSTDWSLINCRLDQDVNASYRSLRDAVLQKLNRWVDRKSSEWRKLEADLRFLAQERGQDVTNPLQQLSELQSNISNVQTSCSIVTVENLETFEATINQLYQLHEEGNRINGEYSRLRFIKNENLEDDEKTALANLRQDRIPISKLREELAKENVQLNNQEMMNLLKSLYEKGWLEIILQKRD